MSKIRKFPFKTKAVIMEALQKASEGMTDAPDNSMIINLELAFVPDCREVKTDWLPWLFGFRRGRGKTCEMSHCLPAPEAADYLEQVAKAIRERRLYQFMQDEAKGT